MIRNVFFSVVSATAAGMLAAPVLADEPHDGQLVEVEAKYVFAPVGFDDNDEAVVVVDGYLPSGCYKLTRPEVVVDRATKSVKIRPMARYFDVPCIEALVPYHFDVKLGVLPVGNYAVTVAAGGRTLTESMAVAEATSSGPDDYLYAPIDEVSVAAEPTTGKLTATLQGRFTRSCLVWDEVKVIDTGKTINVLPIMKLETQGPCDPAEIPFKKTIDLPGTIVPGRHLLHVRSLNGQAVNILFYKSAR